MNSRLQIIESHISNDVDCIFQAMLVCWLDSDINRFKLANNHNLHPFLRQYKYREILPKKKMMYIILSGSLQ